LVTATEIISMTAHAYVPFQSYNATRVSKPSLHCARVVPFGVYCSV